MPTNRCLVLALGLVACGHPAHPADNAASAPPPGTTALAPEVGASPPAPAPDAAPPPSAAPPPEASAPPATPAPVGPVFEASAPAYPSEGLRDVFEKNEAKFLACFEPGRKRDPKLRGRVNVKFTIGHDGKPTAAEDQGLNLEDLQVIRCVVKLVKTLRFTKPVEGSVTVVYPFIFHASEPFLVLPESATHK